MKSLIWTVSLCAFALPGCSHGGSSIAISPPTPEISVENAAPFEPPQSTATGDEPSDLALADFNGDGAIDLATANFASGDVSVVANASASGSSASQDLGQASHFGSWSSSASLAAADFDQDADADLAVLNRTDKFVRFLKNATPASGSFSFAAAGNAMLTGPTPWALVAGDWNADGKSDIAVSEDGNVIVLDNVNTGMNSRVGQTPPPRRVSPDLVLAAGVAMGPIIAADTDGDGKPELAAASMVENTLYLFANQSVPGGASAFAAASVLSLGNGPVDIVAGDLDEDGRAEIATANQISQNVTLVRRDNAGAYSATSIDASGSTPVSIALGDVDGDGKLDLVLGDGATKTLRVLYNHSTNGNLAFATSWETIALGSKPGKTRIADWNGDGVADLVTTDPDGDSVTLLVGAP